ncbi:MAG TPA: two-component regulator propeller domain-containing protein [Segetibacter sp.]|nr:two-component regulator propeller domain-containing protein [Segetibacter sp.]
MKIHFILICLTLLLDASVCQSQNNFVYTRFTKQEGLASTETNCVYQDKKGFFWIGTTNGLNLYDCARFHYYRGQNKNELPASFISQVINDKNDSLWVISGREVGIFNSSSYTYNTATIYPPKPVPDWVEYKLSLDSRGNLFLNLYGSGVLMYDKATHSFSQKNLPFTIPPGWTANYVCEDSKSGNYFIGADSGIAIYDIRKQELFYKQHNPAHLSLFNNKILNENVSCILIDSKNRCWTLNRKDSIKVFCYDIASDRFIKNNSALKNISHGFFEARGIYEQKNGRIWVYGLNVLLNYDENKHNYINNKDRDINNQGIMFNRVNSVMEDKEQNLWIATDKGLYVLTAASQFVHTYTFKENTDPIQITSILITEDKKILVGTWGQGIIFSNKGNEPVYKNAYTLDYHRYPGTRFIWGLLQHSKTKDIWAACQDGAIVNYNEKTGKKTILYPPVFNKNMIPNVIEDKNNNLWFATMDGTLIRYEYQVGKIETSAFKLVKKIGSEIPHLLIDKSGLLWVSSLSDGLYVIDPATAVVKHHFVSNGRDGKVLFNNFVNKVQQYNDSIFFAIGDAINIINVKSGSIKIISTYNGLPSSAIRTSLLDNEGFLWICTADEMYRYNYPRNSFASYGKSDGFINLDQVGIVAYKTEQDTLIFAGTDNVLMFDPKRLAAATNPPDVTIGWFGLYGRYLPMDSLNALKEVKLNYDQNSFAIFFSATSFQQKNSVTFYYKLNGIDEDWHKIEKTPDIDYNLLPPGHYTFMVRCENDEGLGSLHTTTLNIYIQPPFWKTWWFIALTIFALAGCFYYIYRLKINKLLAVQKMRSKVARDLHDDVGATLTSINILSEMAKRKTNGNVEAKELIEKISDNSSRMMEAMDDIVWSINPNNDSMKRITARMREYAVTLFEAKNIDYNFYVQEDINDIVLDMEARRDLFLVFKESINNLVKYSKATYANVSICSQSHKLVMKVEDNGIGFDIKSYRKGNGHVNIRKRAKRINAVLDIQSEINKGTCVLLQLPVT